MITQYKITLLAPVHIGSGDKSCKNIDYFTDETGTYLIDSEKFFQALTTSQINELTNSRNIIDFMRRNKFNAKEFTRKKISSQRIETSEINRFITDSFENPYLPGSSLKGALRTVIARHLIKEENIPFAFNNESKKKWAFTDLGEKIFGKDPNHDFLKGLMVVDSYFKPTDLTLHLVKVFTLKVGNTLSVKLKRWDDPRSEMCMYCEFLKENSTAQLKIKMDDFFFDASIMKKLGIEPNRKQSLLNLREIANSYAKEMIEDELKFFSGQEKLKPVFQFYTRLLKTMEANRKNSFVLNLGWGTGWNFKTGRYIGSEDLDRVRRQYKMGRIDGPIKPFPKSRKIMFNAQEAPFSVPGWIMLTEV